MKKIIILSICFSSIFIFNYFLLTPTIVYAEDNFCSGIEQDLNTHVNNQISSRLSQAKPETGLDIYSYRGTNNYLDVPSVDKPWKRNINSWTQKGNPLDFTGVSGWNDDAMYRVAGENHNHWSPYTGGATLVTPRHFIAAEHFQLYPGTTVVFFDKNGKPVKRKVLGVVSGGAVDDINVGLLDADVDSSIMSYSVLDYTTLLSYLQGESAILRNTPIVVFNQFAKALIRKIFVINLFGVSHFEYSSGPQKDYSSPLVNGDSGQPGFIIINNEPVLLFTNHYMNSGSLLGSYIDKIDLAIDDLDRKYGINGNYNVKKYNSSCFTRYSILNRSATANKNYGYVGDTVSVQISNIPYNEDLLYVGFGQLKVSYVIVPTVSSIPNQKAEFKIPQVDPGNYQIILAGFTLPFQVFEQKKTSALHSAYNETSNTNVVNTEQKPTLSHVSIPTPGATTPTPAPTPTPTPAPIMSSTATYSNVTDNSATLQGQITSGPVTTRGFEYGLTTSYGLNTSQSSSATGSYTMPVSGLSCNMKYYFRAYAASGFGTGYSTQSFFTTSACAIPTPGATTPTPAPTPTPTPAPTPTPTPAPKTLPIDVVESLVKNNSAPSIFNMGSSNITTDFVVLTGSINSTGGTNVLVRGFEYGYSSASESSVFETGSFGPGNFSVKITGLSCGSIYKFRVFAKNSIGLAYSAEKTFTTAPCPLYYNPSVGSSNSRSTGSFSSGTRSVSVPVGQSGVIATNSGNNQSNNVGSSGNAGSSGGNTNNIVSPSGRSVKVNNVLNLKTEIKRNLKIGDSGQDVKLLQTLLNVLGYKVAENGSGSLGNETTFFDKNTELALKKYQSDHTISGVTETGVVDNVSLILINSELNKIYTANDNDNNNSTTTSDGYNNKSIFSFPINLIKYIIDLLESTYQRIVL